jgi:hypothetical protein
MRTYTERILGLLGDRPPVTSLQQTATRIQEIAQRADADGLARPYAPGKWTAAQVLCHLADAEIATGFRLRQVLSQDNHVIQPFDQDRWADRYQDLDGAAAARAFGALRQWNLALIRSLTAADLARPAHHPERGPEPAGQIIKMLAGHDLNHLAQLEQCLSR